MGTNRAFVHSAHFYPKFLLGGLTEMAGLLQALAIKIDMGMIAQDAAALFHVTIFGQL